MPTFLEAAGANNPGGLDGKSFLSVLLGKTDEHKDYVYSLHTTLGINNNGGPFGIRTVRSSKYRYILNLNPENQFQCALDRNNWFKSWVAKAETGDRQAVDIVTHHRIRSEVELYDVVHDPDNLALFKKFDEVKAHLRTKLDTWMKEQGDEGLNTELNAEKRLARNRKS